MTTTDIRTKEDLDRLDQAQFSAFMEDFRKSILYIDPDAPRHLDWIFTHRMVHGLDTRVLPYRFPNDRKAYVLKHLVQQLVTKDEMLAELPGCRIAFYESEGIFRQYVVEGGVLQLVTVIGRTPGECSMISVGRPEWVEENRRRFETAFHVPASIEITQLVGFGADGTPLTKTSVQAEDAEDLFLAKDAFYPFLEDPAGNPVTLTELAELFNQSRSALMLFVGEPGTGKSTAIRTLQFLLKRKKNVAAAGQAVATHPSLIPFLYGVDNGALVYIEDADKLCRPRDSGGGNDQMDAVLGFTDGVVQNDVKVIIGTNIETLNDVDTAMTRGGRCFKVVFFRKLTANEANAARTSVGLPPSHFDGRDQLTLGDALNYVEGMALTKRPGIGFVNDDTKVALSEVKSVKQKTRLAEGVTAIGSDTETALGETTLRK